MSAIRRTTDRRSGRLLTSPYAKPPSKKPSWSITSLINYFIPVRLRSTSPQHEGDAQADQSYEADNKTPQSAAERLANRGHQLSESLNGRQNAAAGPSSLPFVQPPAPEPSPSKVSPTTTAEDEAISPFNLEALRNLPIQGTHVRTALTFLEGKRGQNLNDIEVEGLISILSKADAPIEEEPVDFRFSNSPTSSRGNSPSTPSTSQQPRRLTKNPNGEPVLRGGGSARPRRRYRSPAFGQSKPPPSRLRIPISPETPKTTDNKRRRVGDDAATSTSQAAHSPTSSARSAAPSPAQLPSGVQFPATPGSPINGKTSPTKANGNIGRLRAIIPTKPTTPAVPSPLRQAWGNQSDASDSSPPPASRPTKAANFMAELIKEATPPKKPDVSNPYQTASPVKPTHVRKQTRMKRPRPAPKPASPPAPEVKEPILTPQAIIEATVPKGSKRSRPPAHLTASSQTNGWARPDSMDVDEVDEVERAASPPKKQKKATLNGNGRPSTQRAPPSVTIEEIVDEDADRVRLPPTPVLRPAEIIEPPSQPFPKTSTEKIIPPAPTSSGSSFFTSSSNQPRLPGGIKSSLPKEPSKLRFSIQPEASAASSAPIPQLAASKPESQMKKSGKDLAQEMSISALPSYSFSQPSKSSPLTSSLKLRAQSAPISELPTFDFTAPLTTKSSASVPPASSGGFNWAAAGIAPPPKAAASTWTCGLCGLSNPATATEKCEVCETPR